MPQLSVTKRLEVVEQYLAGLSYQEIADLTGVGKGSVSNIIKDLKQGQFPEVQTLEEKLEVLRDLALRLKGASLTPSQAQIGLSAVEGLVALGIDPKDVASLVALCEHLTPGGTGTDQFIEAALYLQETMEDTGMDTVTLQAHVHELNEQASELEKVPSELKGLQDVVQKLEAARDSLADQVTSLGPIVAGLEEKNVHLEEREESLTARVTELESRSHEAETKLAKARKDIEDLAALGLSTADLSALYSRVEAVAGIHKIKPAQLRDRLFDELGLLDQGLTLVTVVEAHEKKLEKLRGESKALTAAKNRLQSRVSSLKDQVGAAEERLGVLVEAIQPAIEVISDDVADSIRKASQRLVDEQEMLIAHTADLATQCINTEAQIHSNHWTDTLRSLFDEDSQVDAYQLRNLILLIMKSLNLYFENHHMLSTFMIRSSIQMLTKNLEGWKP